MIDYIMICDTYVPQLMQIKESVERIAKEYGYADNIGYLTSKRPEHLLSAMSTIKAGNVPYAILGCPLERPAIATAVQMVWEQFGLSHVVICHREGMELKPGAYKLSGVYGPQPVSVVQPQALIKAMRRLLRKYPTWSETVNRLNNERQEAELNARLRLQAEQREWLEQEQAHSVAENEL